MDEGRQGCRRSGYQRVTSKLDLVTGENVDLFDSGVLPSPETIKTRSVLNLGSKKRGSGLERGRVTSHVYVLLPCTFFDSGVSHEVRDEDESGVRVDGCVSVSLRSKTGEWGQVLFLPSVPVPLMGDRLPVRLGPYHIGLDRPRTRTPSYPRINITARGLE